MLHHGMIILGVSYSVPELTESGNPYRTSRSVEPLYSKVIKDADIIE